MIRVNEALNQYIRMVADALKEDPLYEKFISSDLDWVLDEIEKYLTRRLCEK